MLFFTKICKFLKEIDDVLPIYIIRRVSNTLLRNGGDIMQKFVLKVQEEVCNVRKKQNYRNMAL